MTTADSLPELINSTRNKSPMIRLTAVRALGKMANRAKEILPTLVGMLSDTDAKVRESTAQAIGNMGVDAIPVLSEMLHHSDKYVRRNAVWSLGKLGPQARCVLPDLCRTLQDEDPRTASGAAQALGSMGADGAEAVAALAEAMRGTNIVLCRLAAKALSQIGFPALPTLILHLRHHDPFVRGEAAVAIGWIGAPATPAVPALIEMLRAKMTIKPTIPPPASSKLTPPTAVTPPPGEPLSPEESSRVSAAQALGRIGPQAISALGILTQLQVDPCPSIRQAAEFSVRQIRGQ